MTKTYTQERPANMLFPPYGAVTGSRVRGLRKNRKVIDDRLVWLPKSNYGRVLGSIRSDLTLDSGETFTGAAGSKFKVYEEKTTHIGVPRFYAQNKLNVFTTPKEGSAIDVHFKGKLMESKKQPEAKTAILKAFKKYGGATLSLPCGYGKTVVSLFIASEVKQKTLVIVHKEFLLNQWEERISEFLPDASVGRIQGDVCDVEGKDIVIGMLQSLSKRDYDGVLSSFGLVIVDEAHRISAPVFSRALMKISARYTLGLTATPERRDGLESVFKWFLGGMCYKATHSMRPDIFFADSMYVGAELFLRGGNPNLSKMITFMSKDEHRTKVVLVALDRMLSQNRKILLLSDRVQLLKDIQNRLGDKVSALYIGGMTDKSRREASEKQVVLATYPMAREGLDIPTLDTLIMATPTSNVEQAVGRLLRSHPDKKSPLVIDFVDQFGIFSAMSRKRARYYQDHNYRILKSV